MELETLMPGEPALHLLCLVRGVIVDDEMQIETGRRLAVDLPAGCAQDIYARR